MSTRILVCQSCGREWERLVQRGQLPRTCPDCKPVRRARAVPVVETASAQPVVEVAVVEPVVEDRDDFGVPF